MPSSLFLPAAAVVLAATVTAWPLVKLTDTQAKDKGAVCLDGELIAHVTLAPGRGNPKAVRQIALGNLQAGRGRRRSFSELCHLQRAALRGLEFIQSRYTVTAGTRDCPGGSILVTIESGNGAPLRGVGRPLWRRAVLHGTRHTR